MPWNLITHSRKARIKFPVPSTAHPPPSPDMNQASYRGTSPAFSGGGSVTIFSPLSDESGHGSGCRCTQCTGAAAALTTCASCLAASLTPASRAEPHAGRRRRPEGGPPGASPPPTSPPASPSPAPVLRIAAGRRVKGRREALCSFCSFLWTGHMSVVGSSHIRGIARSDVCK